MRRVILRNAYEPVNVIHRIAAHNTHAKFGVYYNREFTRISRLVDFNGGVYGEPYYFYYPESLEENIKRSGADEMFCHE